MNALIISTMILMSSLPFPADSKDDAFSHLNEDMNMAVVKKTKDGWQCAGVTCPKKFTASCKVTKVLKPTELVNTDLLIICLDKNNKAKCGITRTRKGEIQEVLDMDEDGNSVYSKKEVYTQSDGTRIPRCPRR